MQSGKGTKQNDDENVNFMSCMHSAVAVNSYVCTLSEDCVKNMIQSESAESISDSGAGWGRLDTCSAELGFVYLYTFNNYVKNVFDPTVVDV